MECALTGAAGLEQARARSYDAILLDLKLPDAFGLAVLEQLTLSGVTAPVIVMSGMTLEEDIEPRCKAAGAVAFCAKTLDFDDLLRLLRFVVGPAAGRRHPESASEDGCRFDELPDGDGRLERALTNLRRMLRKPFPRAQEDVLHDAAVDAILNLLERPADFDATRGTALESFLFPAAVRNVLNRFEAEKRRQDRHAMFVRQQWCGVSPDDPETRFQRGSQLRELYRRIRSALPDPRERRAALSWLLGRGSTGSFAEVLGLAGLSRAEQKREIKRWKEPADQALAAPQQEFARMRSNLALERGNIRSIRTARTLNTLPHRKEAV